MPGRQWRPFTPEEKALPEGAGLAPRANGMPGFSRAKMKDVPEERGEVLLLPVSHYLTNGWLEGWGRIASGSSVPAVWELVSLNL